MGLMILVLFLHNNHKHSMPHQFRGQNFPHMKEIISSCGNEDWWQCHCVVAFFKPCFTWDSGIIPVTYISISWWMTPQTLCCSACWFKNKVLDIKEQQLFDVFGWTNYCLNLSWVGSICPYYKGKSPFTTFRLTFEFWSIIVRPYDRAVFCKKGFW